MISSPRCAGRQCSAITSGAARSSSASFTCRGRNGAVRSRPSASCPIDTQVSVTTTSAPSTAACGSATSAALPPVSSARAFASRSTVASGVKPSGAHTRTCSPAVTPPSSSECAMLFAPSPRYVSVSPASRPNRSRIVCRSASTWQGWNVSVRALTTGTVAAPAISSIRVCAPRTPHDRRDVAGDHAEPCPQWSRRAPVGWWRRRRSAEPRRAGRCPSRTRGGCAWSSCRTARRRCEAPPAAAGRRARPSARPRGRGSRSARPA